MLHRSTLAFKIAIALGRVGAWWGALFALGGCSDILREPVPYEEGCAALKEALAERCGPAARISCPAQSVCDPCCADWERAEVLACAERIRSAASCVEAQATRCAISCREWAE